MKWSKAQMKDVAGTSFVGEVTTTYAKLVKVFGKPHFSGDKTTAEWVIKFGHGSGNALVATIYDWKERKTPKGEYAWHIGGTNSLVVELVRQLVAS